MKTETKKLLEKIALDHPYLDMRALKKTTPSKMADIIRKIPELGELQRLLRMEDMERKVKLKQNMKKRNWQ